MTWTRCSNWRSASPCSTRAPCWPKARRTRSSATRQYRTPIWEGCASMSLLELDAVNTFYGDSHILFDVSMRVEQNEVVALLGRNGAGKTTTLRTIMGVLAPGSGTIRLDGKPIGGLPPYVIARMGMQLVPEERGVFGGLTVEENLRIAGSPPRSGHRRRRAPRAQAACPSARSHRAADRRWASRPA